MAVKFENQNFVREAFSGVILRKKEENTENNAPSRELELSFSSELPYRRWWGNEILSHADGAVALERLQEIGVVLYNHNRDNVIGRVLSVEQDTARGRCTAKVRLDEDELSEWVFQKVSCGTLKGVSVGYSIDEWVELEEGQKSADGRFEGPCIIATKWTPNEISIVSVPADASVGIGRQMEEGDVRTMNENENITPPVDNVPDNQARAEGEQNERQRVMEITSACRQFGVEPDEYIKSGATINDVNKSILDKLAKERNAINVTVQLDEADKFREVAADGLAMRCGIKLDNPAKGAEEFRGKRLLRLAAECIERAGTSTSGMSDEMLVREALTGTGQFAGILSNVAHKSMAQAYQAAPTTFQLWTGTGSNSDFKEATRYRLSEADELVKMTENGEFKDAVVGESKVTASVATYGRSFSITRKAIINDDLGALSRIPSLYGVAARRMINKMVYAILADNPVIEGANLFHKNHNNLAAVDISVAGIGALKSQMARQKNIGGKEYLNIQPAFLIVPPELEVTAAQLINSVVDPTKANATPNPFANKLTVISDPELADVKAWYLAAASGYCPTVEVTYLNGNEAPTMESSVQFDTLGIKWRIYHDVGVNLLDFRGLQKSTGGNA